MAEDPVDGANTGSGVLIAQQVPASNALVTAGGFNGFFAIQFVGTDDPGARLAVEGNIFTNLGANIVPQGGIQSQADVNDNGTLISPANATTTNVTGSMAGPVDTNGRATAVMHIGTQNLTLAFYILAPPVPASSQSGRAFAVDITPIATSKQVLTGQFYWLGNSSVPVPPFDSTMI